MEVAQTAAPSHHRPCFKASSKDFEALQDRGSELQGLGVGIIIRED